eukprot:scaffold37647_cov57-Phaeocystis_antarctica.AAC.1
MSSWLTTANRAAFSAAVLGMGNCAPRLAHAVLACARLIFSGRVLRAAAAAAATRAAAAGMAGRVATAVRAALRAGAWVVAVRAAARARASGSTPCSSSSLPFLRPCRCALLLRRASCILRRARYYCRTIPRRTLGRSDRRCTC